VDGGRARPFAMIESHKDELRRFMKFTLPKTPADELRLYIVFRADLPEMTRAKGEVQAAHAAASLIYEIAVMHGGTVRLAEYMAGESRVWAPDKVVVQGQPKIVMEVGDDIKLNTLMDYVEKAGLPVIAIRDEGRTCFSQPTFTCLAFGPCTKRQAKPFLDAVGAKLRQ
jgi:peptidyl-tRNA hydrolase